MKVMIRRSGVVGLSLVLLFGAVLPLETAYADTPLEDSLEETLEAASNTCNGKPITNKGTGGADSISTGSGNDVIHGFGGNDTLAADGGNDDICGGSGADTLSGGSGVDHLKGGAGGDTLRGLDGSDLLRGRSGADTIRGGDAGDTITDKDTTSGDNIYDGFGIDSIDVMDGAADTIFACDDGVADEATWEIDITMDTIILTSDCA